MDLLSYDSEDEDEDLSTVHRAAGSSLPSSNDKTFFVAPKVTSSLPGPGMLPTAPKGLAFLPVQGDWPGIVYIEVPREILPELERRAKCCATSLGLPLRSLLEDSASSSSSSTTSSSTSSSSSSSSFLHVSLSRMFTLRQHQISPFVNALRDALQVSSIHGVAEVDVVEERILINEKRSRSFAATMVVGAALLPLIAASDTALAKFGKMPFYDPPLTHVSLATTEGDASLAAAKAGIFAHFAEVVEEEEGGACEEEGGAGSGDAGQQQRRDTTAHSSAATGASAVDVHMLRKDWGKDGSGRGEGGGGRVFMPDEKGGSSGISHATTTSITSTSSSSTTSVTNTSSSNPFRWTATRLCCRLGAQTHILPLPT